MAHEERQRIRLQLGLFFEGFTVSRQRERLADIELVVGETDRREGTATGETRGSRGQRRVAERAHKS